MKIHKERFEILDGLRGFASFYVVVHHARLICWESYYTGYMKHPQLYNYFDKGCMYFFSFFKYGSEAVTLFFVLSGLVIHYKHAHAIQAQSNNYEFLFLEYFKKRITRIYPPFLFSILLMIVLAIISTSILNSGYPENLSFNTIIGNLTFIMVPYFSIVGNNFPLWSLRVEWWIYLIYPILFTVNKSRIYFSYLIVIIISMSFFLSNLNQGYFWVESFLYLPTWCIGAYLADLLSNRIKYYKLIDLLVVFIPVSLVLQGKFNNYVSDFFFALGLIPFFYSLLIEKTSRLKMIICNLISTFKGISKFSYTLYIIHFPIQVFFVNFYLLNNKNQLPHSFYLAIFSIITSILLAYLSHFFTERKIIRQ